MVALDARVVAPLLPTIARDFDTSVGTAGWLVSAYMLPYGLCQLVYGPIADRVGKVRVVTHAMIAFSVGTALCGAFPSFGTMVTMRALTGAAAAALIPLTIAYIGDTVPYGQRQAALAMLMASSGAAQAFSTSIGGMIAAVAPWRLAFPVLGAMAGVSTAFLYANRMHEIRIPREADSPPPRYRDALRARGMLTLLALVAIEGALYISGFSFLSGLVAQRFGFSPLQIGLLMSLTGVAQLISARLLPRLLRRTRERSLLLGGGAAMALAYLICARAGSWPWIAVGCLLLGSGFSLCHTTLQTRATELLPSGRGTALALFAFSLFSGNALGTVGAGYAVDSLGYGITFGGLGIMMLAFTALLSRLSGARRIAREN